MSLKTNIDNKNDWLNNLNLNKQSRKVNIINKKDLDHHVVVPLGDIHLGSKHVDKKTLYDNLEWCEKTNSSIILMGDLLETATRDSVGSGVYDQEDIVQGQLEEAVDLFKPLRHLIVGSHVGNHENRVYKGVGLDLAKVFCNMIDVPYLGVGAGFIVRVGNQSYTMYTSHGSSGARLPTTKILNVLKMNQMIDADVYCHAHLHELAHFAQDYYKINKSKKTIDTHQKHYVLTGSYLKHWGSYAHVMNMTPAKIGSPKIKFGGLEKRIRVSL